MRLRLSLDVFTEPVGCGGDPDHFHIPREKWGLEGLENYDSGTRQYQVITESGSFGNEGYREAVRIIFDGFKWRYDEQDDAKNIILFFKLIFGGNTESEGISAGLLDLEHLKFNIVLKNGDSVFSKYLDTEEETIHGRNGENIMGKGESRRVAVVVPKIFIQRVESNQIAKSGRILKGYFFSSDGLRATKIDEFRLGKVPKR